MVYSVGMFSHRHLDSDHINFRTFVFMAVYGLHSVKVSASGRETTLCLNVVD